MFLIIIILVFAFLSLSSFPLCFMPFSFLCVSYHHHPYLCVSYHLRPYHYVFYHPLYPCLRVSFYPQHLDIYVSYPLHLFLSFHHCHTHSHCFQRRFQNIIIFIALSSTSSILAPLSVVINTTLPSLHRHQVFQFPVRAAQGHSLPLVFVFQFPVRAAWLLTPVRVRVPGEGRMVSHSRSCSSLW